MDYDKETGEVIAEGPPPTRSMPPEIARSIIKVMKGVKQLGYDDHNKNAGYNFVSIDKFMASLRPLMAEAGLFPIMEEVSAEVREQSGNGKSTAWMHTVYDITWVHETGVMWGPLRRRCIVLAVGAQAFASSQSFLLKYFLRAQFLIPTGDKDVDSDAAADLPHGPVSKPVDPPAQVDRKLAPTESKPQEDEAYKTEMKALWKSIARDIQTAPDEVTVNTVGTLHNANGNMAKLKAYSPDSVDKLAIMARDRIAAIYTAAGEVDDGIPFP